MDNIRENKPRGKLCLKKVVDVSSKSTLNQLVTKGLDSDLNDEKNLKNDPVPPDKDASQSSSEDSLAEFKSPNTKPSGKLVINKLKEDNRQNNVLIPSNNSSEDSLADFKSPNDKPAYKPILEKFKVNPDKAKKKIIKSKNKTSTKTKKIDTHVNQPSIESSFFKPQTSKQNDIELKVSYPCPLCLKPFKDDTSQFNHMKICASKNKVTIKQLLDAKQLQDRQAEERKALGLPAAPIIPEKKKVFRSKNYSTGDDQQLQLVMALSESLFEAKQQEEIEQAAILAGIPSECVKQMTDEERRTNLQNFGFTTTKPIPEESNVNKTKKKKLLNPTVLQTRSQADKDRVLTERIACILTGDDALTQSDLSLSSNLPSKNPIVIKSKYLDNILQTTNRIWDKSKLTKKFNKFYVEKLETYLFSNKKEVESNNVSNFSELQEQNEEGNISILDESIKYEPIEINIVKESSKKEEIIEQEIHEFTNMDSDIDFMKKMISNWGEALNDSRESDIIIFVKNDKHIYAHKLVFYVQCHNLLKDVKNNDTTIDPQIKEKINWIDKEEVSALAFLEFIYCGIIFSNISVFENENQILELKNLAKFYRVNGLIAYVSYKQNEIKRLKNVNNTNFESTVKKNLNTIIFDQSLPFEKFRDGNESKARKSLSFEQQSKIPSDRTICTSKSMPLKINSIDHSHKNYKSRRTTVSPDLFESEPEPENESVQKIKEINSENKESSQNLEAHATPNLINENLNLDDTEFSDSQKTIVNLSDDDNIDGNKAETEKTTHEKIEEKKNFHSLEEYFEDNTHLINEVHKKVQRTQSPQPSTSRFDPNEIKSPSQNTSEYDYIKTEKSTTMDVDNLNYENSNTDAIYNAVTPPRPSGISEDHLCDTLNSSSENINEKNHEPLEKISFLDKYIEKIKKQNAKDILDTDSEHDSPVEKIKNKHRFLVKNKNDSYSYLLKDGINKKRSKAISLIEHDAMIEKAMEKNIPKSSRTDLHQNNSKKINLNKPQNQSIIHNSDSELGDETVNESDMSMYSKYKKHNKHHNSIQKYRNQLNFDSNQSSSIDHEMEEDKEESIESGCSKNSIKSHEVSMHTTQDLTLVSDSDEELSKSLDLLNENTLSKKVNKQDDEKNNCKDNSHKYDLDANNSNSHLNASINETVQSKIQKSNILKTLTNPADIIELLSSSDEECTQNIIKNKSKLKNINSVLDFNKSSEDHILESTEKRNDEVEAEISKIFESSLSPKFVKDDEHKKTKHIVNDNKIEQDREKSRKDDTVINLSPISIISSLSAEDEIHLKKNKSSDEKSNIELNSLEDDCLENFNFENDWSLTPPKNLITKDNSLEDMSPQTNLKPFSNQNLVVTSLISSPILSQGKKGFRSKSSKLESKEKNDLDQKIFKTKSVSALNETEISKKNKSLKKSSSFSTPDKKKMDSKFKELSDMDTPDLNKELKKFGLKPQNRKNAEILLRNIYNAIPSASQKRGIEEHSSSEDEKMPPLKKKNLQKTIPNEPENCEIIPEEMEYEEEDTDTLTNIGQALKNLLKTDQELSTKVLTYHPLSLESLHSRLKQNGCKCKLNSLMDYLDQQCITFQMLSKGSRTKKKNKETRNNEEES